MPGRKSLHREYELLEEIRKNPRASIRELCERTGIKSSSHVHSLLKRLEDEGLISRERYLSRSIELDGQRRPRSEKRARHVSYGNKNNRKPRTASRRKTNRTRGDGWTTSRKQTKQQLDAAIERVVNKAKTQGTSTFDNVWHLRKDYVQ